MEQSGHYILPSISNHGVRTVVSFTFGMLLLGTLCFELLASLSILDLLFGYFWTIPLISTFTVFGAATTHILVTFWKFSQTKEEKRIPKQNPSQG